MIRPYNPLFDNVLMPKMGQKHFHFNPSRAPVRNIISFRGEPSNPLACKLFPRREPRDPAFSPLSASASPSTTDMQPLTRLGRGAVYGHPRLLLVAYNRLKINKR